MLGLGFAVVFDEFKGKGEIALTVRAILNVQRPAGVLSCIGLEAIGCDCTGSVSGLMEGRLAVPLGQKFKGYHQSISINKLKVSEIKFSKQLEVQPRGL